MCTFVVYTLNTYSIINYGRYAIDLTVSRWSAYPPSLDSHQTSPASTVTLLVELLVDINSIQLTRHFDDGLIIHFYSDYPFYVYPMSSLLAIWLFHVLTHLGYIKLFWRDLAIVSPFCTDSCPHICFVQHSCWQSTYFCRIFSSILFYFSQLDYDKLEVFY